MSFGSEAEVFVAKINEYLDKSLKRFRNSVSRQFSPLVDAMQYSVEGGGKRLRPTLVLSSAHYLGISPESVLPAAAAVEFIHTYSLVHDDLPAMDDDDERRGKPSNHKKFGEGIAILAGDALCTEAFRQILKLRDESLFEPENILNAVELLSCHAGVGGMVGGQYLDITSEESDCTLPELEFIHIHKTGALIKSSVLLPAYLKGVGVEEVKNLRLYGEALGLAFQISDDLLDADTGNRYSRGPRSKPKPSYTRLMAPTEARARLKDLVDTAIQAVQPEGDRAQLLVNIADFIRTRKS